MNFCGRLRSYEERVMIIDPNASIAEKGVKK
jgi:hypothetical protein